ncbi:MAG: signal peptidase II [Clostridiales bacterium]|nr:signal peptidase II [Clostridiales bacterium]
MLLGSIIVVVAVLLDQLVKSWAVGTLQSLGSIPFIDNIIHLTYAENTGAAFSLMRGGRWVFVCITVAILSLMIVVLKKGLIKHPLGRISIFMIMGGAIGNLIDRVVHGYVVDMIEFRPVHFAIFNIADCFVTVGGILFAIYIIFLHDSVSGKKEETQDGT